jgi:hypothetical protein
MSVARILLSMILAAGYVFRYIRRMADIYIAIRNENNAAMSSVNGEFIVVLVSSDNRFQNQQFVTLQTAMAAFQDLSDGDYTIIARHPDLTPTEARYDVRVAANAILGIRFVYNEVQYRLLRIDTEMRFS